MCLGCTKEFCRLFLVSSKSELNTLFYEYFLMFIKIVDCYKVFIT
jgi:hypothetical protein